MQMDNFCAKFNQLCGLACAFDDLSDATWLQSPILQKLQDVKGLLAYSALSCVLNEVQIEMSSKENPWATELSPTAFITTSNVLHVISPIFLFHMSTIWIHMNQQYSTPKFCSWKLSFSKLSEVRYQPGRSATGWAKDALSLGRSRNGTEADRWILLDTASFFKEILEVSQNSLIRRGILQ